MMPGFDKRSAYRKNQDPYHPDSGPSCPENPATESAVVAGACRFGGAEGLPASGRSWGRAGLGRAEKTAPARIQFLLDRSVWADHSARVTGRVHRDAAGFPFASFPSLMREVGRNDPCPCGSGVKYKYCCLHKDQDETPQEESPDPPPPESATPTEPPSPSPAMEAWDAFEASDYDERRALIEDMTGDPERMDGENAFHMFNEIASETFKHGDADWLIHVLTRLDEEQPETYAAERAYLLSRHLEAAAVAGRVDEVAAERTEDLATVAVETIDEFYPCLELIAYHGSLAPIAEAMDNALEGVRESSNIMPFGKQNFADRTVPYAVLAYYEQHGTVDLQDPALRDLLDRIDDPEWGEVDFAFLEQFAARLNGPTDRSWRENDDLADNIHRLTVTLTPSTRRRTSRSGGPTSPGRRSRSASRAATNGSAPWSPVVSCARNNRTSGRNLVKLAASRPVNRTGGRPFSHCSRRGRRFWKTKGSSTQRRSIRRTTTSARSAVRSSTPCSNLPPIPPWCATSKRPGANPVFSREAVQDADATCAPQAMPTHRRGGNMSRLGRL